MKSARLLVCLSMAVGLLTLFGQSASAQSSPFPVYAVGYFNLGPHARSSSGDDNALRIVNPGSSAGNLCANIYLFDSSQNMQACCSCNVSLDGMLTLSVQKLLGSWNKVRSGVIKVISGDPGPGCSATSVSPTAELRGWSTLFPGSGNSPGSAISEPLLGADLSAFEFASLQAACGSASSCSSSCP